MGSYRTTRTSRRGFSLLELVITVLIIATLATIASVRLSRMNRAASESALAENLRLLRNGIEAYHAEHGAHPTLAGIKDQLTQYTDAAGQTSATRTATAVYGPYLKVFPGYKRRGGAQVGASTGGGVDWVYDETTGVIYANAGGSKDDAGKRLADY